MIGWAVETLIASSLLMLLVLLVRHPVRRAFGPNIAYALWALPGLRMLLPPLPEGWRGSSLPVLPIPEDIIISLGEPVALLPAAPAHGIGWPPVVLALWIAGTLGFVGFHLVRHRRFCAQVRRKARRVEVVAAGQVEVIETDAATGPLAFGVWRKSVAFPRDFAERYDPLERDLALAHELGHHARGDLLANWAALLVLGIHWFNPVAWRAFRAFRADQEMACDALVLSGREPDLRHAYGRAIVKSAHGGAVSAACHLHTVNELKGRLRMLTRHERTTRPRAWIGSAALAALTVVGLGATASGTQAAERVRDGIAETTGVDLAAIELPPLPQTAPEPPALPEPPLPPETLSPRDPETHRVIVIRDKDGKGPHVSGDAHVIRLDPSKKGKRSFIFRNKDGEVAEWDMKGPPPAFMERMDLPRLHERLKNMPEISSRDCRDGEGKPGEHVINRSEGGKRITIICNNRIERVVSLAAAEAGRAKAYSFMMERHASESALGGLRSARRTIERNENLSPEQRASALAGVDQAIRELESKQD